MNLELIDRDELLAAVYKLPVDYGSDGYEWIRRDKVIDVIYDAEDKNDTD